MRHRLASGQTLAATLIVLAIIAVLAAVYFIPRGGQSTRKDGKGTTIVGGVMYKAKDTVCKQQLGQIRDLIYVQTETSGEDTPSYPATLNEIRGVTDDLSKCPVGKEPYQWDQNYGKVRCPHPGHENY